MNVTLTELHEQFRYKEIEVILEITGARYPSTEDSGICDEIYKIGSNCFLFSLGNGYSYELTVQSKGSDHVLGPSGSARGNRRIKLV